MKNLFGNYIDTLMSLHKTFSLPEYTQKLFSINLKREFTRYFFHQ